MKSLILIMVTVIVAARGYRVRIPNPYTEEWKLFKLEYNKTYETKEENVQHMRNFINSKYEVAKHNQRYRRGEVPYALIVNQFSDMSLQQFTGNIAELVLPNKYELGSRRTEAKDVNIISEEELPPASATVDASSASFKQYHGGVYHEQNCSSQQKKHAVMVVGYGSDKIGGDYWLVKNSFGAGWGENGYMRVARGNKYHCGIAFIESPPVVEED